MNYFENIKDTEIIYYIYRYWAPPLITIIVGGAFASIIWPRLQDRYIVKKKNAERFAEISEAIYETFPNYVVCWRRLIQIATAEVQAREAGEEVPEAVLERKNVIVFQRNETRDKLIANLRKITLFCSGDCASVIEEFLRWDENQSVLSLEELPPIEEWRGREMSVLKAIKKGFSALIVLLIIFTNTAKVESQTLEDIKSSLCSSNAFKSCKARRDAKRTSEQEVEIKPRESTISEQEVEIKPRESTISETRGRNTIREEILFQQIQCQQV